MAILIYMLIALVLGYFVWNFFSRKWREVYISQNIEEFMSVSGALHNAGIHYKSSNIGQEFNSRQDKRSDNLPAVSYNILVREDKMYQALEIINQVKFNLK